MSKYSNRMIITHWLTLVVLIAAWYLGDTVHDARHDHAATIAGYLIHSIVGATVLLLTLARFMFRSKDGVPAPLGDTPMDKMAKGIQHLMYLVLILLPVSGTMQVLTSDVGAALLAGDAAMLPTKISGAAHEVHEQMVNVLIVLVVVHVFGALKHQFVTKDNIMSRMSLRNKQ